MGRHQTAAQQEQQRELLEAENRASVPARLAVLMHMGFTVFPTEIGSHGCGGASWLAITPFTKEENRVVVVTVDAEGHQEVFRLEAGVR